jgi:hypothetical protein
MSIEMNILILAPEPPEFGMLCIGDERRERFQWPACDEPSDDEMHSQKIGQRYLHRFFIRYSKKEITMFPRDIAWSLGVPEYALKFQNAEDREKTAKCILEILRIPRAIYRIQGTWKVDFRYKINVQCMDFIAELPSEDSATDV